MLDHDPPIRPGGSSEYQVALICPLYALPGSPMSPGQIATSNPKKCEFPSRCMTVRSHWTNRLRSFQRLALLQWPLLTPQTPQKYKANAREQGSTCATWNRLLDSTQAPCRVLWINSPLLSLVSSLWELFGTELLWTELPVAPGWSIAHA